MNPKFGIDVVRDKYLKVKVDRKEAATLELDIFPETYSPKLKKVPLPLYFSLDFKAKESISVVGVQLVSQSTKVAKKKPKR